MLTDEPQTLVENIFFQPFVFLTGKRTCDSSHKEFIFLICRVLLENKKKAVVRKWSVFHFLKKLVGDSSYWVEVEETINLCFCLIDLT